MLVIAAKFLRGSKRAAQIRTQAADEQAQAAAEVAARAAAKARADAIEEYIVGALGDFSCSPRGRIHGRKRCSLGPTC